MWRKAITHTNDVVVAFWKGDAHQADVDAAFEEERRVFAQWGGPPEDGKAG